MKWFGIGKTLIYRLRIKVRGPDSCRERERTSWVGGNLNSGVGGVYCVWRWLWLRVWILDLTSLRWFGSTRLSIMYVDDAVRRFVWCWILFFCWIQPTWWNGLWFHGDLGWTPTSIITISIDVYSENIHPFSNFNRIVDQKKKKKLQPYFLVFLIFIYSYI